MNAVNFLLLLFTILGAFQHTQAQHKQVHKTNPMPVYMHYMPWFDTPETSGNGQWGWHWTMNNKNPNTIIDPATAKREIASHFYPLVGPYASNDPDILEYHLLLMKFSGIDGILIDWYGEQGSNGDVGNLLRNSNAIIEHTETVGLQFAIVLEDRFASSLNDAKVNVEYLEKNYFNRPAYIRLGANNDPLLTVFGPITFQQPEQWTEILAAANEDIEFLPLWNEAPDAGQNADGEYAWIWEDEASDNYYTNLENYYHTHAPQLKTVMGVAYPGFIDFYKEGNAGDGYFKIPHDQGATLDKTLNLAKQYKDDIDILQLATWNDFGEGTMIEPTYETGFEYLKHIQQFTGVSYGSSELLLIYRLYQLRKAYKQDPAKVDLLNQAAAYLADLNVTEARTLLDTVEPVTQAEKDQPGETTFYVYPNPVKQKTINVKVNRKLTNANVKLSVRDLSGRIIYEQEIPETRSEIAISTEKFEKGVYVINLHFIDKVVATRFIVLD